MTRLACTTWAASGDTLLWSGSGDGEDGLHDTTKTFTSDDTSGEGETDSFEVGRVALLPDNHGGCTHYHRETVLGLWEDEGETGGRWVGNVSLVFGGAEPGSEDDESGGEDGEADRQDTGSLGHWKAASGGDGDGNRSPCASGWDTILADGSIHVENAWGGGGEEDEEAGSEEDGSEGTAELSEVLSNWLGADEVTGLEITSQIGSLSCGTTSNHTGEQVDSEGVGVLASSWVGVGSVLAVGDTTNDELGSLGDGGDWVNVGDTSSQDTNEGKDESEDDGEDRDSDIDLECNTLDNAGDDDGDEGNGDDDEPRDLIPLRCWVNERSELGLNCLLARAGADHVADLQGDGRKASGDGAPFNGEFDEGGDQHDEDTNPEEVVSRRSLSGGWVLGRHAVVASEGNWAAVGNINTNSAASCDHSGTNDTPGEDGATVEGEGSVDTGEDTSSDESWGPFNEPSPVVEVLSLWCAPNGDPVEYVPVVENAWDVGGDGLLDEAHQEGPEDPLALLLSIGRAGTGGVEGSDSVGGGRWSWEGESLSENEESSEGDSEGHAVESAR